jgi:RNA polymerase sigma factor (sigma-70 family)
MARGADNQDILYARVAADYGSVIARLARGYERDASHRADLIQDIHIALWRSFETFDERCSLRTWVYRVTHNVSVSHIIRQKRRNSAGIGTIEEISTFPAPANPETEVGERSALNRLIAIIDALKMPDRQIMMLYLEELDAAAIGEVVGMSPSAVATKVHRIKAFLVKYFQLGESKNG